MIASVALLSEVLEAGIEFNRDVRSILSDKCWSCHGPDANSREADLRLDLREAALSPGGDDPPAIVPGDARGSLLVRRIQSADPDEIMPPADHRKKLTEAEKRILVEWIEAGATWEDHWAWMLPKRAAVPGDVHPVDHFIRRRLGEEQLESSPPAASHTLVRRLSFDLRGLPPEPEDVAAFSADRSVSGYRGLVDRYLSQPAFGERLAVYWLDLVRYADTNGYHADIEWEVSPYRDYVIDAFNENLPFDRFTREQIAGDLLPDATTWSRVAAGYHRLNMKSTEFGIQDAEYLARYAADRVRTTSTTWLGVTLGCAECHDHKFDPFSIKDFYRFAAYFADIKQVGYYPDAQKKGWGETMTVIREETEREMDAIRGRLEEMGPAEANERVYLRDARAGGAVWRHTMVKPDDSWMEAEFDDSDWAEGASGFGSEGTPHSQVRTAWTTGSIWLRHAFEVKGDPAEGPEHWILEVQHDEEATIFLNGKEVASLKGYSTGSPDYHLLRLAGKHLRPGRNLIAVDCRQSSGGQFIDVGLKVEEAGYAELKTRLTELEKTGRNMLATRSVKARPTRVLPRGNWMDESGEVVTPAVPAFLSVGEGRGVSRLDLADWLIDRNNPLTARVFVNRLWKLFFGSGLSRVLDDVGSQGEWPTHPELLDWLAVEFMDSGWDVKHLVRLIVTSETYQQRSRPTAELLERDPQNRWLARQSRFRLDAEFIRDNALAVSGLLVTDVGGPSVKPYQPPGYWDNLNFPKRTYQADQGEAQWRRGLYVHWQRQFLHPALSAFDAPSREECTADRPRSNTPTAALVMLNDPTQVEAARALAERGLKVARSDGDRIRWLLRRVLSREALDPEVAVLRKLLVDHRKEFAADPEQAGAFLGIGQRAPAPESNRVELAAWTSAARALLNLGETIVRY